MLRLDRVQNYIVTSIRDQFPTAEIKIQSTRVLLSRSGFPAVAVRLQDVSWQTDRCAARPLQLSLSEVILPVNLWALFKLQLKLSTVELNSGHVAILDRESSCVGASVLHQDTKRENQSSDSQSSVPLPEKKIELVPPDLSRLAQHIGGVRIQNLVVTFERDNAWKALVHNLQLGLGRQTELNADVQVDRSSGSNSFSHGISIHATSEVRNPILKWHVRSGFKEGSVDLTGELDWSGQAISSNLKFRQIPMRELLAELNTAGLLHKSIDLKSTWLSCDMGWDFKVSQYKNTPVEIKGCHIEGAYGNANLGPSRVLPFNQSRAFEAPIVVGIEKAQLSILFEAFGVQPLSMVVSKWGEWSGQATLLSLRDWRLEGYIDGLEVIFSHQSVRGKQLLRRLKHSLHQLPNGGMDASIDGVEIVGGDFSGHAEMKLNSEHSGQISLDIERMKLSQEIQNLLLGGPMSSLKISGRGDWARVGLVKWDGKMSLKSAKGKGWLIEDLSAAHQFKEGQFSADLQIGKVALLPDWPYLSSLNAPAFRDRTWVDVAAQLSLNSLSGSLERVIGQEKSGAGVWRAKGSWKRDGDLSAELRRQAKGVKPEIFKLRFSEGAFSIN